MEKENLVIYHGKCSDGFGAAYSAWKQLGDSADYVPMTYDDIEDLPNIKNRNTRALVRKIKRFKDWIFSNDEYDAHYVQVGDGLCIITRKDHNENRN